MRVLRSISCEDLCVDYKKAPEVVHSLGCGIALAFIDSMGIWDYYIDGTEEEMVDLAIAILGKAEGFRAVVAKASVQNREGKT